MIDNIKNINVVFSANNCKFFRGVTKASQLPNTEMIEVAIAGRSNVGKSSLINALTKQTKLARTSKTPGCTQQLNFYDFANLFYLVDLPGYGYARESKNKINEWNQLIFDYLSQRRQLLRLLVLVDARRGVKHQDLELLEFADHYALPAQIILTKIDKLNKSELAKLLEDSEKIANNFSNIIPHILSVSSAKNRGLQELRQELLNIATQSNE